MRKKKYRKPNICEVDFEILDLILESVHSTGEHGWEFDDEDEDDFSKFGGFSTRGF